MGTKISIITICFNNLEELKTTCSSVDMQTIAPFEHWIIDGSSTSDIRDYLTNNPQPPYRNWISEKDDGIADAFNKGINNATGDVVNMLNSADYYLHENTLSIVSETFHKHPGIKWLHSKYKLNRGGKWVTIGKSFDKSKLYRGMRSLAHQSMFVKKELHTTYGLYDKSISIAMDYDFVCRIANEPFVFIDESLIVFAPDGTSSTNYMQSLEQAKEVYEKYFGRSIKLRLWQIRLKLLYRLIQSPIGKTLYNIKVALKLENM